VLCVLPIILLKTLTSKSGSAESLEKSCTYYLPAIRAGMSNCCTTALLTASAVEILSIATRHSARVATARCSAIALRSAHRYGYLEWLPKRWSPCKFFLSRRPKRCFL